MSDIDKATTMAVQARSRSTANGRPKMLAVAGDSGAGKTTLTKGLVEALGPERCVAIRVGDYHRYDRMERKELPFTPLHPDCNYIEIMEQHLQLLASGQPILKPVYDHSNGTLNRPELVEPAEYIIAEGPLALHTRRMRACFDATVYLDPPEEVRREWKVTRDTTERGYTREGVIAELDKREPEAAAFIRPQRKHADIVVRFAPIQGREDPPGTPLSATVHLRPSIPHLNLEELAEDGEPPIHLELVRDEDGRPVDALHVHGYAPSEDSQAVQQRIWNNLGRSDPVPPLGQLDVDNRSEPLAITQLLLLYHLLRTSED